MSLEAAQLLAKNGKPEILEMCKEVNKPSTNVPNTLNAAIAKIYVRPCPIMDPTYSGPIWLALAS
jgi:hypothetical protein